MGRQSIKALIGMIVISVLLGAGVLLYAYFSKSFSYTFKSNLESNRDYYYSMTKELEKAEVRDKATVKSDS